MGSYVPNTSTRVLGISFFFRFVWEASAPHCTALYPVSFLTKNPLVTTPVGSIGVMNFYFFDPGDFGPGGPHRPDLEVKLGRSKSLTP